MSSAAELVSVTPDPGELQRGAAIHLAAGAGCLAAAAAFIGQGADQRLRIGLAALALFLPLATIVLARIAAHHRFPRFGAANAATTVRAVLTCLFAGRSCHVNRPRWRRPLSRRFRYAATVTAAHV